MGLLTNKVGVVTGAAKGLGRACCEVIVREGGKVVVADLDETVGRETADHLRQGGGKAEFCRVDVSKADDVAAMVAQTVAAFGGIDFAVNNAMLASPMRPLAEWDDDEFDRNIAVNLRGMFLCLKHEIRVMLDHGGGSIVNIGSGNEHAAVPGSVAYTASKRGILGMTAVAALEYGAKGIRVNAVGAGTMLTPALQHKIDEHPDTRALLEGLAPMHRISDPHEVAEAVVWLLSDRASFILGHTLVADGGVAAGRSDVMGKSG